jgi:hypothetical protein
MNLSPRWKTANPVQTSGYFGVKKDYPVEAVDGGNPLVQMERFPVGR